MSIIFIAGTADKNSKEAYITALANRIPNSIYLNVNNIYQVFSQPPVTEFTEKYSYEQRILWPSHTAVMKLMHDNLLLKKLVILDGHFNYQLVRDHVQKLYPELLQEIQVIYLHSSDAVSSPNDLQSLKLLAQERILMINTNAELSLNLETIFTFINLQPLAQQNNQVLVMGAGLAGTGKTTHLKISCSLIASSVYLDKDTVAVPFLDEVKEDMPSPYYNLHVKSQSYAVIFKFALDNLQLNKTTILDGCFGDRLTSTLVSNYLASYQYRTTVIYFQCTGATQLSRIMERGAQRDTEKLKDIAADRKINIEKHLSNFSQISLSASILYINTESKAELGHNIIQINQHITSPDLKTLKMQTRIIPYDERSHSITQEEAQGGLNDFLLLLQRSIIADQSSQEQILKKHVTKGFTPSAFMNSRNTLWAEMKQHDAPLKLTSGPLTWRPQLRR